MKNVRVVLTVLALQSAAWSQEPITKNGDVLTLPAAKLVTSFVTLVKDAAAPGGEAVASGEKAGPVIELYTLPLPAGRYLVTLKMQIGKRDAPQSIGIVGLNKTGVPLVEEITRRLVVEDFEKAGVYRDFSREIVLAPQDKGKAGLYVRVVRENANIPLRVASIEVKAVAIAPVLVSKVSPKKLLCRCNADQSFSVTVHNLTDQPKDGLKLKLDLIRGLSETAPVGSTDLSLKPFETREVAFSWNTGDREYGYEARAALMDGQGNALSRQSEYFAVSRSHFKLRLGVAETYSMMDKNYFTYQVMRSRLAYANYTEMYGWAPGSFVELYPRHRFWSSGQVCEWVFDRDILKAWIEEMHRQGMWVTAYNISLFNGWPGQEAMRKHPEWCSFNKKGRPDGGIDTAKWQSEDEAYGDDKPPKAKPFTGEMPNSGGLFVANDELMKHGANEICMIQKELGFDGVRWDGHPVIWTPEEQGQVGIIGTGLGSPSYNYEGKSIYETVGRGNRDKQSLHNMLLIKDAVRKVAPEFEWGYNMGYDLTAEAMPLTWKECTANAGIWVEGGFRSGDEGRSDPNNTWAKFMDKLYLSSQFVLRSGGYPIHGALSADSAIIFRYLYALELANGAHPAICASPSLLNDYSRFATRYCEYLFDPRIHPWWGTPDIHVTGWVQWEDRKASSIPPVGEEARVEGARPIWFEKLLFHREVSKAEQDTIVHLINDPGKPYMDYTQMDAPPPQDNVSVSVRVPKGMTLREVWCLSPDTAAMGQTLKAEDAGAGWIKVTVPRLVLWDIVVFNWGRA